MTGRRSPSWFRRNLAKDFLPAVAPPAPSTYKIVVSIAFYVLRCVTSLKIDTCLDHFATGVGILALCDLIRHRLPILVVIDPLFRLAHIRDEKAYAETYAALGPLIDTARFTGTHVLATHHAGKSLKADAIDSPLGSTAIGGAVSALFVMRRNEAYRTLQSVQRVGPDMAENVLKFDADSKRISLSGTRSEADQSDCEQEILAFLMSADDPQTQEQIRDGVGGQTRVTRAALTALVAAGRVAKNGDGKRGKPFLYECWFSGSEHIVGTREPETENALQTLSNVRKLLVPEISPQSILVPDTEGCGFEAGDAAEISAPETTDEPLLDAPEWIEDEEEI
jgi:hypothetical protein